MDSLQTHQQVYKLITGSDNVQITGSFIEINYSEKDIETLKYLGFEIENIRNKRIRFFPKGIIYFKSIEDFLLIKDISDASNILIINPSGSPISYIEGSTYINFERKDKYFLFINTKACLSFLNFLKQQEKETEDSFHFVDYYNKDARKIVFTSLSEQARLIIHYNQAVPNFNPEIDYSKNVNEFKKCFSDETYNLPKFLKNSMIKVASGYHSPNRFEELFKSLDVVIERARINFEVYLNNLSIDKIKKEYDDLKGKYFNSLSDVLAKMTQKMIALPIGISAIIFAADRVKGDIFLVLVLLISLVITSIYLSLVLKIHIKDLNYFRRIFNLEYKSIEENNFFNKHPDELSLFEEVKNRFTERVDFLKLLIEAYYWILNSADIFIICYILYWINVEFKIVLLVGIILFGVFGVLRNKVVSDEN